MRHTEIWHDINCPELFRYIEEEFIDNFLENGELLITTLNKCREHEKTRRDESEGVLDYISVITDKNGTAKLPDGVLSFVDEQGNPIGKAEALVAKQIRNCYLLCMSSDDQLFQKFRREYAIRIHEPWRFFKDVHAALNDIIPLRIVRFGQVIYDNDRTKYDFSEHIFDATFVKDTKFARECEWRACFVPQNPESQMEPLKICCPNARRWCEKISLEQAG